MIFSQWKQKYLIASRVYQTYPLFIGLAVEVEKFLEWLRIEPKILDFSSQSGDHDHLAMASSLKLKF